MAFPCCMNLNTGIRLAALISLLLGILVCGVSGWLFNDTYELRNSAGLKALDAGADLTNTLFGAVGIETKVDVDKVLRIKLFCSGAVFVGGALQVLTSLLLICCSATKGGRASGRLFVFINTFVLIGLVAAGVCFLTSGSVDYEEDKQIQYFLAAAAADAILLIYLICVAGAFVRS